MTPIVGFSLDSGRAMGCPEVIQIGNEKRARVQERHWAHFVSAIRLSKSSPSRTMTPKPAAGLPTEVVNDNRTFSVTNLWVRGMAQDVVSVVTGAAVLPKLFAPDPDAVRRGASLNSSPPI